jgi:glycosyltransferase involved in cell wall biosynthesis
MNTHASATIIPRQPQRRFVRTSAPRLEIVIPVKNAAQVLRTAVESVHRRLASEFDLPFRVTIADNASTDNTAEIARSLARELPSVRHLRVEREGRGRALRAAWTESDADVVACIDVEFSADVGRLPELLAPLLAGHADIVIGSRLVPGAHLARARKREAIARGYCGLLGMLLGAAFSDPRCGFKAARREVVQALLPLVEDEGGFFDTEFLYLAQRNAYSIREVPVDWVDDADWRARTPRSAIADLKGIARLRRRTREGRDRLVERTGAAPAAGTSESARLRFRGPGSRRRGASRLTSPDSCGTRRPGSQPTAGALP